MAMTVRNLGLLLVLLLFAIHPTRPIVTPFTMVPECAADAQFVVPNFKANWFKAIEYCHYLGRSLVTVSTEQQQHAVDRLLDQADHFSREQSYWSGANDLADDDNFHWHRTGQPVAIGWSNWRGEVPLRDPSTESDAFKVRCVALLRTAEVVEELQQQQELPATPAASWAWTVANCWRELYFICERSSGLGCR
ncbi:uncharacterized protein LOC128728916 [Anopheles nili]|uniref:uncharacterized protein LOC128728916 n=1 Tax=Anopheles nili TaxID=185578 RepID=UPI00237B1B7D|nr:uncharacterized protein LOC128728916 [Anopheles nili]